MKTFWRLAGIAALLAWAGCASAPADHEYVTDYRVVGDRTVKYLYVPGETSRAGGMYLDEAVALEICSVQLESEKGDENGETDRGETPVERNCETTRLLKTEEYQ